MSTPKGWKQVQVSNNPKIFYESKIGNFVGTNGQSISIFAVTDTSGNFDIYQTTSFSVFGSRGTPIYTYNQSGKESGNRGLLTLKDFNNIRSSVKQRSFEINRSFGTEGEKRSLQESNGYKTLATNTARTGGAAAPGATPAPGAAAGTPTTTQGGTAEGTPTTAPTEPDVEQASAGPTTSLVIAKKDLIYPLQMKTSQDVIKFQAYQLKSRTPLNVPTSDPNDTTPPAGNNEESPPPNLSEAATYFTYTPESRDNATEQVPGEKAVYISIQSPISDQNVVDWSPGNMSAVDYALFGLSMRGIEGQLDFRELAGALTGEAGRYRDRITKFAAGQAASVNNILARTDNVVLNPNLELLFNAPQLRSFSFTFKMSARGEEEAKVIKNIIRYFKYHMAVRKEQGLFLKAPHVFIIDYIHKNLENHPGINQVVNLILLTTIFLFQRFVFRNHKDYLLVECVLEYYNYYFAKLQNYYVVNF